MTTTVTSPGAGTSQRTTGNTAARYKAGVLKYKEMGYWVPDYEPKPTDVIACFRITPQEGSSPTRPRPPWPASPPRPPGPSSGRTG